MKKLFLAAVLSAVAFGAAAQSRSNLMTLNVAGYEILLEADGSYVRSEGSFSDSPRIRNLRHRAYSGHIGNWELGFNGLTSPTGSYAAYPDSENGFADLRMGRSFHLTANIFTFSASFTRSNVFGVTMGVGISSNDYVFETPSGYAKIDGMLRPTAVDHHLKKAKLNTVAIHIPLALELSPARGFFISAGGYVDVVVGSHMKWKFPKEKLRQPYTNFLQAGVTARVGFRKIYFFGSYGLVGMFRDGRGPEMNPYAFGVGFGF